jgi:MYXO-CTERM domain-containing protein
MQERTETPADALIPVHLDYAASNAPILTAGFSKLSLAMAVVTVFWLAVPYLCWTGMLNWGPFAPQRGGPIGEALADDSLWPIGITVLLAVAGFFQRRRRRRWLGAIAIVVVCVAFPVLMPGLYR